MNTRRKLSPVPLAASTFLLVASMACSSLGTAVDTPAGPGLQAPTSEPSPIPEPVSRDTCSHPYYPVKQGASWDYEISGSVSATYTHSILSAGEGEFVDQDVFSSGTTRTGQWKCEDGNLVALTPGGAASVGAGGLTLNFTVTSNSGVTLPANPESGSTWSQEINYESTQEAGGMQVASSNQAATTCTASGRESVTVPAGTFDALKVECSNRISISISGAAPIIIEGPSTTWYVEDVGMVKTVTSGSGFDSTIVLTSYQIP